MQILLLHSELWESQGSIPLSFHLSFQCQDAFFLGRPRSASPVSPGPSNENLYRKVWRREGETLSVPCSYKNRRNFVEAKSWCKVKKKKCDHNFVRSWVRGPSYSMRDDTKAKVVRITMEALRVQDSGRYWCMRNTAGNFYPLVGFQLEVYPGEQTGTEPGWLGECDDGSLLGTSSCQFRRQRKWVWASSVCP